MKTFKQWFNSLSDGTQAYLQKTCDWIDRNTEDGYRKPNDLEAEIEVIQLELAKNLKDDRYFRDHILNTIAFGLFQKHKNDYDDERYYNTLIAFDEKNNDVEDYLTVPEIRKMYQIKTQYHDAINGNEPSKYGLSKFLLMTEDFDNIDWSRLNMNQVDLNTETCEILGHDQLYKIAKENPGRISGRRNLYADVNNVLFDELFFCEDGWTAKQKELVINNYCYNEQDAEDFMRRIVAVDESYLRYIGKYFIYNNPALAMYLYKQKKPDDELNALPEGHKIEDEYRYPKSYRKLFLIAGCCARERIGKAMTGSLREVAPLLKMYGYNFNTIFDCLYPKYAEVTNTESQEQTV